MTCTSDDSTSFDEAIALLNELLDSLPATHPERPGIMRSIELLRVGS